MFVLSLSPQLVFPDTRIFMVRTYKYTFRYNKHSNLLTKNVIWTKSFIRLG